MPARNWKAMIRGIAGIINREFPEGIPAAAPFIRPRRKRPARGNLRASEAFMENLSGAPYPEHPGEIAD
jgi:hypothetical protein